MIILGLTGSIAMGKSTVAAMFAAEGVPVFDSDAAVHACYSGPEALVVEAAFPGVVRDGAVDRERLAARVVGDPAALARLEAIVHPMVEAARRDFVRRADAENRRVVVVDVPEPVQKARALARPGMTSARLEAIMARQMSDRDKRRRAHMIVENNGARETTRAQVQGLLRSVAAMPGRKTSAYA
jgi:dephospho-CoA kinase